MAPDLRKMKILIPIIVALIGAAALIVAAIIMRGKPAPAPRVDIYDGLDERQTADWVPSESARPVIAKRAGLLGALIDKIP